MVSVTAYDVRVSTRQESFHGIVWHRTSNQAITALKIRLKKDNPRTNLFFTNGQAQELNKDSIIGVLGYCPTNPEVPAIEKIFK